MLGKAASPLNTRTNQGEESGEDKGTPSVLPTRDTTGLRRYTGEASRTQLRRRTGTARVRVGIWIVREIIVAVVTIIIGCVGRIRGCGSADRERNGGVGRVEAALRIVGIIAIASVSLG